MRKFLILMAAAILLFSTPAFALFLNGGFETGDTTAWTITGDHSVIMSFTPQFNNTTGWTSGIPYYGSSSLLLGSPGVGNEWDDSHQSTATQTDSITQADLDAGLHLNFKWGALLEEPTNDVFHSTDQQPYFNVEISSFDGSAWNTIYFEDQRANEPGFTKVGKAMSGDLGDIYYGTDIADIDLLSLGLGLGDQVKIDLFVQDCGLKGHGGLVFLDGFGTNISDTKPVPEPPTMLLLGLGLIGLAGLKRKFRKK